jgi:hypothetical protein
MLNWEGLGSRIILILSLAGASPVVRFAAAQIVSDADRTVAMARATDTTPVTAAETPNAPINLPAPPLLPPAMPVVPLPISPPDIPKPKKWDWKASTIQTLEFTAFDHAFRVVMDPSLRSSLVHKPFIHDWFASYGGYDLKRWGDGDDFVVNDVGHPLQGAVTSRIFLQNNPRSFVPVSKNRDYWITLGQSMLWAAIWQAEWKVGPLSETSIGNAGGWLYVPDCGTSPSCLNNPKYPKPPTNNTGLSDWVISPLVGGLWVLGEDTIERFIVAPVARNHRIFGGRILRGCLEPSRDFAALFAGKFPWQLANAENNYMPSSHASAPKVPAFTEEAPRKWEFGTQYTNISLPVLKSGCRPGCRENISGFGFNIAHDFTRWFGIDSTVNVLPGQDGSAPMTQGMFGAKFGERFQHWGVFAKIRPGFIYYENAYPGGGDTTPGSLTRFAWDFGGIVEAYTHGGGTFRVDLGTTVVRYLADAPDRNISPLGSLISNQYYVNQGNLQVSAGYVHRF